ncbi:MAG: hypothetical protein FWD82_05355 [Defluviitaleaceae bacterium]|nr:hypothetical protein [Defluviitaleaceae bacterium]
MRKKFLRLCVISLIFIAVVSIASVVYGLFTLRELTLEFVFIANFAVGAIILAAAILRIIAPVIVKKDRLTDHSTYAEKHSAIRETKHKKGYEMLFIGLLIIVFTAILELLIWLI